MKTRRALSILPLLGALALGACEDGGPADLAFDELALEDQVTLELLADPSFSETAVDLLNAQTTAAHNRGRARGLGQSYALQAQEQFLNAQTSLAAGNITLALEQARKGRELIARGIEAMGGPRAIEAMVERLEALPLAIGADPECYQDPQGLGQQMGQLAQGARNAFRKGKRIQAGGLGVLGEQAIRQRLQDGTHSLTGRPEIWVDLGAAAVDLATDLLAQGTPDQEQLDLLAAAQEYMAQSRAALEAGELGRAIHFAHQAQWWALKAVVLPGGITEEEAAAMLDLARSLLADAEAAVGAEPTELETAFLAKAKGMLTAGEAQVSNGVHRGVGALWQVAVIATYLLG